MAGVRAISDRALSLEPPQEIKGEHARARPNEGESDQAGDVQFLAQHQTAHKLQGRAQELDEADHIERQATGGEGEQGQRRHGRRTERDQQSADLKVGAQMQVAMMLEKNEKTRRQGGQKQALDQKARLGVRL